MLLQRRRTQITIMMGDLIAKAQSSGGSVLNIGVTLRTEEEVAYARQLVGQPIHHAGDQQITFSFTVARKVRVSVGKKAVPTITMPPGHRMMSALSAVFDARSVEMVFDQILTDEREAHSKALSARRTRQAAWIHTRLNIRLAENAVLLVVVGLGKRLAAVWKLIG